jgi:predicted acylesterase/phospholipase RssA/CRP-like cAMP-binding protein
MTAAAPGVFAEDTRRLVAESAVFGSLTPEAQEFLATRLEAHTVPGGEVLVREGDDPDSLYLVVFGRLRVAMTRADGTETVIAELGRGEIVGEMALLTNEPRSATVVAVRDSQVLRLPTDSYAELVQRHPDALRQITTQVVRRFVRSYREGPPTSPVRTIAVIPLDGSPGVMEFDERLHASLQRLTSAANHVTVATMTEAMGDVRAVGRDHLASWLAQMESGYEVIVYEADGEPGAWTDACVRQADVVLLVGDARGSPHLRPVEQAIAERRRDVPHRTHLVLVHPAGTRDPRGTRHWRAPRTPERHHHAAEDSDDDIDRIARLLLNRGIGVVFSGGGARGIAGIGVVQALDELGIPIDAVGGTSIGSIIGGGVARKQNADEIATVMRRAVLDESPFDVTFPAIALAAGKRITLSVQQGADGLDIEDGWRSYFCVSSNLTRGDVEVHRTGPGWLAVRASASIPGVFPPVVSDDGDVLVDGGVLDNMPIGIMRAEHQGITVIAVDVGRTKEFAAAGLPEGGVVSGWKTLLAKVDPRGSNSGDDMPNIGRILMRLTELGGRQDDDRGDVAIRPDIERYALTDFKAFDKLVSAGREAAMESLGDWSQTPKARALIGR